MSQADDGQRWVASPFRVGQPLSANEFAGLRRTCVLEHCKWDPQVGDRATLAPFPVFISQTEWAHLQTLAEKLAAETEAAERELLQRPTSLLRLGMPRALQREFLRASEIAESPSFARVLRFDFHFTREGWIISEVNALGYGGTMNKKNVLRRLGAERRALVELGKARLIRLFGDERRGRA